MKLALVAMALVGCATSRPHKTGGDRLAAWNGLGCALSSKGAVVCFSAERSRPLSPTRLDLDAPALALAASESDVHALLRTGRVVTATQVDDAIELGLGPLVRGARALAAADHVVCALRDDDRVSCWGHWERRDCVTEQVPSDLSGRGPRTCTQVALPRIHPTTDPMLRHVRAIAATSTTFYALTPTGIYAWQRPELVARVSAIADGVELRTTRQYILVRRANGAVVRLSVSRPITHAGDVDKQDVSDDGTVASASRDVVCTDQTCCIDGTNIDANQGACEGPVRGERAVVGGGSCVLDDHALVVWGHGLEGWQLRNRPAPSVEVPVTRPLRVDLDGI